MVNVRKYTIHGLFGSVSIRWIHIAYTYIGEEYCHFRYLNSLMILLLEFQGSPHQMPTFAPLTKYYCLLLLLWGVRSNIHYGNFEGIPAQCLLQIALTYFWALRDNDGQQLFSTSVLQMIFGHGFFGGDCGGIGVAKQKRLKTIILHTITGEVLFFQVSWKAI